MEDRRSLCGDLATIANAIAGVARAHHLDAEQCEEWTQIAWLKVLGSTDLLSKQFRGEASFRTYLGTVLNNRCLDWLAHRTRSQQQAVPVDDVRMALERASARAFVDAALNTEECRRTERRSEVMHAAFEQLDSADRELLNAYFGERTARRALLVNSGCTPEALRQRVHRALVRLRQLMMNNRSPARPPARPPSRKIETGNLKLQTVVLKRGAIHSGRRWRDVRRRSTRQQTDWTDAGVQHDRTAIAGPRARPDPPPAWRRWLHGGPGYERRSTRAIAPDEYRVTKPRGSAGV